MRERERERERGGEEEGERTIQLVNVLNQNYL